MHFVEIQTSKRSKTKHKKGIYIHIYGLSAAFETETQLSALVGGRKGMDNWIRRRNWGGKEDDVPLGNDYHELSGWMEEWDATKHEEEEDEGEGEQPTL